MRKIFIIILTSIFIFLNNADAQLTISMSNIEVDPNAQASVDVTVNGFTNLDGIQFSINYDSLILSFVNATNFSGALPGLSAAGISGPNGVGVKKGQITFNWFNQTEIKGKSLPNGTRLFTLNFIAIGAKCTKSDIQITNTPRMIEAFDLNLNPVNVITNKGSVTVKCDGGPINPCPDPTCTNASNLTFTGAVLNAEKDKTICVPITVKNFKIMQSGQGSVSWDPTILQFIEVKTPTTGGIPGFSGGFSTANVATGKFIFLWSNETPAIPLTLPDNTVIMEFCFKAIGNIGQTGCVLFGTGTLDTEWETDNGTLPICISYGKVTINNPTVADAVTIKVGTINGKVDSIICVDVTVENFKNVVSLETKFSWDATQLEFIRTDMYNLQSLNSSSFSNSGNMLNFSWNVPDNLITLPNGHKIFQICFKIKQCLPNMVINVPGPTEVGGEGAVEIPSQTVGGSVTCTDTPPPVCTATCVLGAVTNVSCNGRTDGAVALTVNGTNLAAHMIVWKNNIGGVVKASAPVTSGTNLTGVAAGTYTYEVSFNGTICCSGTATVVQPSVITIPSSNVVTNVGCGQKGAINITATSGGNGGFTYAWTPNQGNTANPTNLDPGAYSVVVTDSKGCTASTSFTVGNTQTELVVTSSSTNVKCRGGSDGSIQINASGGCPAYTYTWTGGLSGSNPQNVKAGTYSVTVTDTAIPVQSKTVTVTVGEPASAVNIALTGTVDASTSTASDGKISLNITGGSPNYTTVWSGPTSIPDGSTSGAIDANNVRAGSYNVTVTDANGCTSARSSIIVGFKTPIDTSKAPKIASASVSSNFNGFGVTCFGDSNGSIVATLSEGAFPITVNLKSGTQTFRTITINNNDISFTGLVAGTYIVEVINAKGTATSGPLVITQPTKLAATVKQNCSEKNKETGNIELNLNNTGAVPYNFNWFGSSDIDNKLENLAKGFYNVTVTDANNCELRLTNIEITECPLGGDCYIASTVITPNGDNFNDTFIINCVKDNSSDLSVFDRWGRLIYAQSNYDDTWQGIDKDGKDLKEGAYIWVLTVNFGQGRREVYKGTVTVLRAN